MALPHHHDLLLVNGTHAGRSRCGYANMPEFSVIASALDRDATIRLWSLRRRRLRDRDFGKNAGPGPKNLR